MKPILYIVIPCYNEEKVLPLTSGLFRGKLTSLSKAGLISEDSRVLFVNDGSRDSTWKIICSLSASDRRFSGISLSRNRGHQNALLAGLMESRKYCDIAISIDCDGQDDIDAMDDMVREYLSGSDIVYGGCAAHVRVTASSNVRRQEAFTALCVCSARRWYTITRIIACYRSVFLMNLPDTAR